MRPHLPKQVACFTVPSSLDPPIKPGVTMTTHRRRDWTRWPTPLLDDISLCLGASQKANSPNSSSCDDFVPFKQAKFILLLIDFCFVLKLARFLLIGCRCSCDTNRGCRLSEKNES
ncbi:hypothetical protein AVEN_202919-1 [Araneus ventricosus]|uniref:Uncharacterized protein n=1 Tax=Araneus ventricosus TaxID=182803 RepID=A0A4Y2K7V6_ARAVE|nr:hypothetical protein AVEN_202919-1 [Araneus ventricosus]